MNSVSSSVSLVILIIVLVHSVSLQKVQPVEYYFNRNGEVNMVEKEWMSALNDSVHLNHLSLPGTHDTMALYGGPFVQTQVLSIDTQLRIGIRAFDIRCRHVRDTFEIHHGPIYQHSDMDKVLQSMVAFLGTFPTEVLLVRLKEESAPIDNSRSFSDTVEHYLNKPFYRSYIWIGNLTVPLGEVRGKIVILRNYPSKQFIGIPWDKMEIQDHYIVPTIFSIGSKWSKVQEQLERARQSSFQSDTFMVNFLSGTSPGAYPCTIARRINRYIVEWIKKNQVYHIGIIFMDFPGEGLVSNIIRLNSGIQVTNGHEESKLEFNCNNDDTRRTLNPGDSFKYHNKLNGSNLCKFWLGVREVFMQLQTGNEDLFVDDIGIYRYRDSSTEKEEIGRW